MDKLPAEKQAQIKKTSDARLIANLVRIGMAMEDIEHLDRQGLMETYAKVVLEGKDKPEKAAESQKLTSASIELERERLAFEKLKWEQSQRAAEKAADEEKRRYEDAKERAEKEREDAKERAEKEREDAKERAEKEREDAKERAEKERMAAEKQIDLERAKLKLKAEEIQSLERCKDMELRLASEKLSKDEAKENSAAALLKRFGTALHYALSPMDDKDNINFLAFIDKFENTCTSLKVPDDLWVTLLRPMLTQRCQTALGRFHGPDSNNFGKVKSFLLHELRLSPEFYSHLFNSSNKRGNETYRAYMSRLTTLLEYYLQSKKVTTFEDLCQLLVCDRVKAQLAEHVLNHVIRSELAAPNSWLNVAALSDVLDAFAATHSAQGSVKYTALGAQPTRNFQSHRGKNYFQQPTAEGNTSPQPTRAAASSSKASVKQSTPGGNGAKACSYCSRKGHTVNTCFRKAKDDGNQGTARRQYAPNTSRMSHPGELAVKANQPTGNPTARVNQAVAELSPDLPFSRYDGDIPPVADYLPAEPTNAYAPIPDRRHPLNPQAEAYIFNTDSFHVNVGQVQMPVSDMNASNVSTEPCHKPDLQAHLAKLPYIRVAIKGLDATVMGLEDTGSMISLINRDLVQPLNLTPVGSAQVRGIVGDAISAPLVYVKMQLVSSNMLINVSTQDDDNFVSVLCAVCSGLNDQLILSMPVAAKLKLLARSRNDDDHGNRMRNRIILFCLCAPVNSIS
jgi:hypothetical protein